MLNSCEERIDIQVASTLTQRRVVRHLKILIVHPREQKRNSSQQRPLRESFSTRRTIEMSNLETYWLSDFIMRMKRESCGFRLRLTTGSYRFNTYHRFIDERYVWFKDLVRLS